LNEKKSEGDDENELSRRETQITAPIPSIVPMNLHKAEELGKNDSEETMLLMVLIDSNEEIIQIFLMAP
jgi:hypothetical protein